METEKIARWKEHFENILNRPEPENAAEIEAAEEDLDICTDPPSLEEVKEAIKMRSGKAAGADGVTAEMLKAEETDTPQILTKIFSDIWQKEEIPEAWKTGLIVKLPKKGDLGDCGNCLSPARSSVKLYRQDLRKPLITTLVSNKQGSGPDVRARTTYLH